jgi:type I restriction enzyme R subunit
MKLGEFVDDYNLMFRANESVTDSKGFYTFYKNLAKRMKSRDKKGFVPKDGVDIVLVVNMFLTGFDAKTLNTLYVDKSLRYHGLIQAFSRTNRTLGQIKSQGNIVCFRNLKERTDEAITLFSDPGAKEEILLAPYEHYVRQLHQTVEILKTIAPTPSSVDLLLSENELLAFVKGFRALIRAKNIVASFADFTPSDMPISMQEFEDYKSKYLDVHDKTKRSSEQEKISISEDVDFELELIKRDEINVAYILELLTEKAGGKVEAPENLKVRLARVLDLLSTEAQLRSKKALIEEFIEKHYMLLPEGADVKTEFARFWADAKQNAISELCMNEKLGEKDFLAMMAKYQFTGKKPLSDEIVSALSVKPSILKRKAIVENIARRLVELVEIFDDEVGNLELAATETV